MSLISWLFWGTVSAFGQDYCDPAQRPRSTVEGGFTLSATRVCVGYPVTITNKKPTATSIKYIYGYTEDSSLVTAGTSSITYAFTKPGQYRILQAGSLSGTAMIHCESITVLPVEPVKFTTKACLGRKVTLTPDPATIGQYDVYIIRWGDGTVETKTRTQLGSGVEHTYGNGGVNNPSIELVGQYGQPGSPLCASTPTTQTVNLVSAATQPAITRLTTLSDNSISIQYQTSTGAAVQLFQKEVGGAFSPTAWKGTGSGTFTVTTNAKQVQCFQIVAQDACNNNSDVKSDEVCSLVLDAKADNQQNNLSWQPYGGLVSSARPFRSYRVLLNGVPLTTLANQSSNSYVDKNKIECGKSYCYSLEAVINAATQTTVTSAPVCVTGINGEAPGAFGNIVVSIENNRPRLIATLPRTGTTSTYTLVVARSTGAGNAFQTVGTVEGRNTFTDTSADPNAGSYCYQLTYLTNCGTASAPSSPVCTVFLNSRSGNSINWTSDSPFMTGGTSGYIVEVIDSLNGTRREIIVGNDTHFEPDPNDPNLQSQKYRVIANSSTGTTSYSNFYTFRREARLLIPDAFTPNGDGMNDVFMLKGLYVDQFTMSIYDRWGAIIYSTSDKTKGWDGTVNGQPAATGQYMYRVEMQDRTGEKTARTGAVMLLR